MPSSFPSSWSVNLLAKEHTAGATEAGSGLLVGAFLRETGLSAATGASYISGTPTDRLLRRKGSVGFSLKSEDSTKACPGIL